MRQSELTQVTLLAGLLESTEGAAPNGAVYISVSRQFDDGGVTFTRDQVDRTITRADLCERARQLWADIAQEVADQDATPVKSSSRPGAPLTMPRAGVQAGAGAAGPSREG